jgi:competence ComEA-like helix-hairpin-helix protein
MSSTLTLIREPRRLSLLAGALLVAVATGGVIGLAHPGPEWVALSALALLPLGALVLAGPARGATIAASLAYVVVLVWAYRSRIAPVYDWAGLIDSAPATADLLIITPLAVLPAAWIPVPALRPSTVMVWVVYLMAYVPAVVLPLFLGAELDKALSLDFALLASMVIIAVIGRVPLLGIRARPMRPLTFTALLTGLSVLTSLYILASFGLRALPSLQDVYGTRADFKLAIGGVPGGAYLIGWATGAINPLLMAWGIARRNVLLVVLAVAGQVLIYSVTGYKASLFAIAFVPLVYAAIAVAKRSFGLLLSIGIPAILALSVAFPSAHTPLSLAARMYATPAQVTWYYIEYFSVRPHMELSHSFLRWFIKSPYLQEPPDLIGSVYFPGKGTHANAGLWADAFANFGLPGIFAFTVAFGVLLWGADSLSRGRDMRIVGAVLATGALAINSGALFTAILTNGIALSLLLILFMPPPRAAAPLREQEPDVVDPNRRLDAGAQVSEPARLRWRSESAAAGEDAVAAPDTGEPSGPVPGEPGGSQAAPASPAFAARAPSRALVNLNTATAKQLRSLRGVGSVTVKRIMEYRDAHGGFSSVEDLKAVPGIGESRFRALEGQVTI